MPTIMRVGGGGGKAGIDLTVVGGTTQPENPKNNTIWVKTETDIGTAYLAPTAPENPAVGDVWINTGIRYDITGKTATSAKTISVLENPFLEINVFQITQWDGSTWNWKDGGVYANSEWTEMALYIFWYGQLNEVYTFEANWNGTSAGTVTVSGENLVSPSISQNNAYNYSTPPNIPIDIGAFSKIGIQGYLTCSSTSTSLYAQVGFTTDMESQLPNSLNAQATNVYFPRGTTAQQFEVPITCSGLGRFVLKLHSGLKAAYPSVWYIQYIVLT